jgi:hypothetical protein
MLAVLHARQDFPLGRAIAFELIRDDHPWHVGQALEQLAEELLRGLLIPPTLHQNFQHVAILIDGRQR